MRLTESEKTTISDQARARVGSALLRVEELRERLSVEALRYPRSRTRLLDDVRQLVLELERGFRDLQDALDRLSAAQHHASAARHQAGVLIERARVASVIVDGEGTILEGNAEAGRMLNVAAARLPGKSFLLFIDKDRESFVARLGALTRTAQADQLSISLRPREKTTVPTTALVHPITDGRIALLLQPEPNGNGDQTRAT